MENIIELEKKVHELQKHLMLMKKERMADENFLHSGEFAVMRCVAIYTKEKGKNPTLVTMSGMLDITQATMTPLVDRLVKKGLLIKEVSESDKRAKLVSLTERGMELLTINRKRESEKIAELCEVIGEEDTVNLIRIIGKINNNF